MENSPQYLDYIAASLRFYELVEQNHQQRIAELRQNAKHQLELAEAKAEIERELAEAKAKIERKLAESNAKIEAEKKLHALTLQLRDHALSQKIARQEAQCDEKETRAAQKALYDMY